MVARDNFRRSEHSTDCDRSLGPGDRRRVEMAWADNLKEVCKTIFSLTDEQLYGDKKEIVDKRWNKTPRQIMQQVGTDCMRDHFSKDIWIKSLMAKYDKSLNSMVVISDCRFQNEVDAVINKGGRIIKIVREPDPNTIHGQKRDNHQSETGIHKIKVPEDSYDYIANNGSIDELRDKVIRLMSKYKIY